MTRIGRKLSSSVAGVIAVAAILLGINLLAETYLGDARLDLTEQKLYTLSPGTKKIVGELKQPITLRLFYSPELGTRLPQYAGYVDRVREMLREYAALAPGKIRLEFHSPEPFSEDEDRAAGYGLQGVPLNTGKMIFRSCNPERE